jgi:hypothetical protein
MTLAPKEYATQLVDKFKPHADWHNEYGSSEPQANVRHAKQCTTICVDEILLYLQYSHKSWVNSKSDAPVFIEESMKYFHLVKQEIQNIKNKK